MSEIGDSGRNIAIFDGDNTLWDTNDVFTEAQKDILRRLKAMGFPADADRDFEVLRRIDDLLIGYFGKREYDSACLPLCLMRRYKGEEVADVSQVSRIIAAKEEEEFILAQELGLQFNASLKRIPRMFPDVIDGLAAIRRGERTVLVLYSEGRESRLRKIWDYYGLSHYFHKLIIAQKSLEEWKKVKQSAIELFRTVWPRVKEEPKIYVIGDLLETDIRPGKLIGGVTIYKPGGYKGVETPRGKEETPDLIVRSMKEIVALL